MLKKSTSVEDARIQIAQEAGPTGVNLYHLTDLCETLNESFQTQMHFPFDFTDEQSEIYHKIMKLRSNQIWKGIDLKLMPMLVQNPETNKLMFVYSLFKRVPKGTNLTWTSGSSLGDAGIMPGPNTPYVPIPGLLQHNSPKSPLSEQLFVPLTQQLDPRQRQVGEIPPFHLDVSTISIVNTPLSCKSSTPDKSLNKSNYEQSPEIEPAINISKSSNSSARSRRSYRSNLSNRSRRSFITRPRKRYTPSPRASRLEKSRILDGEPPKKRPKLDRNRPRAKARKSLQRFLANIFRY